MSFEIHPEKLDTYQQQLTDLAGQTGAAKDYVGKHLNLGWQESGIAGQVVWAQAVSVIGSVRDAITANMDSLAALSTGSSGELKKAAKMYRTTDRAHAKKLDDTY